MRTSNVYALLVRLQQCYHMMLLTIRVEGQELLVDGYQLRFSLGSVVIVSDLS